ncbi:rubrerythrin family protein [Anaerosacchariphilus polymeriproducens]|uniref:Rubrerythrin family protein n=1 Tax=Anaerosacchariphilus polymeriproducens TaxID=1812858 RepID=A0A371AYU3_9FIRM|nr:ferritin family protein [Anaerosacchariphilus polymeriproducens]RDU24719.1 rubrerythrin family protein [Anaerosacchariphilus polymeriproducens]
MDFQESKTFQNLKTAYDFQLKSASEYAIFSGKARSEILIEISHTFHNIAGNEVVIAQRLRKIILSKDPSTSENLMQARDEEFLATSMYRDFAKTAKEEGFDNIASLFNGIGNVKLNHNLIFQNLATEMSNNELFCKSKQNLWICLACGNIISGLCAPDVCPICLYPQGFYQALPEQGLL